jgi:prophage regulatory protein
MAMAILRLPAVKARTGLSRSTIYLRIKERTFPRPIALGDGARARGWVESEVDGWLAAQIEASRKLESEAKGNTKHCKEAVTGSAMSLGDQA